MKVSRVERHIIKNSHSYYSMLDELCHKSKNLYNFANYHIRQAFIKEGRFIGYNELDKLLKQEGNEFDYRQMPTAQSAQQTLRSLEKNWISFFRAIKDWSKGKEKYTGKPKLPKYLKREGRSALFLTNSNCKLKEGSIKFPKTFQGFSLKTKVDNLQQVRILPRNNYLIVEIVYNFNTLEKKQDNNRYFSIDIGIDNLLTVTNNFKETPFVVNGKGLKSVNQYYNKQIGYYKSISKRMNKLNHTKRLNKITTKRNNRVTDFIHKASHFVVESALESNVSIIVIGNNKGWKRDSKMDKKTNQSFVGIPHQELINKIIYKADNVGIQVLITEESYTSGTSFLDNELPIKKCYNKNRRKHRGLFISNLNIPINADVNGSYQILKKVFPNAFADGIEGVGLHPVIVNI